MTTISQAREAIYSFFLTEWNNRTFVTADNEEFDVSDVTDQTGTGDDTAWVRFTVRHLAAARETLGRVGMANVKFERSGQVVVQIYTSCHNGTAEADSLMQAVLDIFDGKRITGTTVRFNEAVPQEVGIVPDGDWFLTVVEIAFEYNEQK